VFPSVCNCVRYGCNVLSDNYARGRYGISVCFLLFFFTAAELSYPSRCRSRRPIASELQRRRWPQYRDLVVRSGSREREPSVRRLVVGDRPQRDDAQNRGDSGGAGSVVRQDSRATRARDDRGGDAGAEAGRRGDREIPEAVRQRGRPTENAPRRVTRTVFVSWTVAEHARRLRDVPAVLPGFRPADRGGRRSPRGPDRPPATAGSSERENDRRRLAEIRGRPGSGRQRRADRTLRSGHDVRHRVTVPFYRDRVQRSCKTVSRQTQFSSDRQQNVQY